MESSTVGNGRVTTTDILGVVKAWIKMLNPYDFFLGNKTVGSSIDDSRDSKLLVGNFHCFLTLVARIGGGWSLLTILVVEDLLTDQEIRSG